MHIHCFTFGPFETNCYVVSDEQHILLIDPACSNEYERQQLLDYITPLFSLPSRGVGGVYGDGGGLGLSLIATPGHTPGSVCLYFPEDKILFSGDTLFRMGYGRTDLPGGNYSQLIRSLQRLFELPSDVRVYPGHGEPTTIGAEQW